MRKRAFLLAAVLSAAIPAAAVEWRQAGPDGGSVTAIAAAANEQLLLAGTAEGLLFRSADRAETWVRAGTGLGGNPVRQIIVDPHNAARVWVGTDTGIYRSDDHGNSFVLRLAGSASQLAVAPANPDVVYAAMSIGGNDRLLKSPDGGTTWAPADGGLAIAPTSVAVDAADPSIVYATGYTLINGPGPHWALWRSSDGGGSWQPTTVPGSLISVATSPTRGGVAIVTRGSEGAYRTTDGVTWTPLSVYAEGQIAFDPNVAGRVYLGWFQVDGGFYRSDDDGGSVQPLDILEQATNLVVDPADSQILYAGMQGGGVLRSDDAGQTGTTHSAHLTAAEMNWLAADPSDSHVLYAGGDSALYRSTDHGTNWSAILPTAAGSFFTEPMPVSCLAVDPRDSRSLWAISQGLLNRALWHSSDTGGSWELVTGLEQGVFEPANPSNAVARLALDSDAPNTIWITVSGGPDTGVVGSVVGAVYKSSDNGQTFRDVSPQLGNGDFIGQLLLDPVTPGRIWIGGTHFYSSPLLYLSADSGQTWTNLSASLAGGPVSALLVDPDHGATIYAALRGPNANDTVPRLFRSDDAGGRWQSAGAGLTVAAPAIDPSLQVTSMIAQRGFLYAALGQAYYYGDPKAVGGVLVSADRGASWSDISGAIEHRTVSQLLSVDPVVASTVGEGIFVQTAGGRPRAMRP